MSADSEPKVRCSGWICRCGRCGSEMRPGVALISTLTGEPDELGGDCVTLNWGGPGRLVSCLKCVACGHSKRNIVRICDDGPTARPIGD